MLKADGLTAVRGRATLFQDLTFEVPAGTALLLRGHNGSGKTTLLRTLAGLASPAAGEVFWKGAPIRAAGPDFRESLVFLGHLPGVSEMMSARENLATWIALDSEAASDTDLDSALERVGLKARRNLAARMLSQGQRRRIGLARLLLAGRPLWLLDEPTSALDVGGIELLGHALERHLASGGAAVVATHQPLPLDPARAREIRLG
jgi:heme exporter protein A